MSQTPFPLSDKDKHPLRAHIYRPPQEEAYWSSTTVRSEAAFRQRIQLLNACALLFFFPFFFPMVLMQLFSRSLKRMFTLHSPSSISVTISGSPLSEYFWEDLRSTLFTSGRYLNVCHICFSHCSIFTGISYQFQI